MNFDPFTDVVRVPFAPDTEGSVAVPLQDVTLLVAPGLDYIIEVEIQDLSSFVSRYIPADWIPGNLKGESLFEAAEPYLFQMAMLFKENFGPIAKDRIALSDDLHRKSYPPQT